MSHSLTRLRRSAALRLRSFQPNAILLLCLVATLAATPSLHAQAAYANDAAVTLPITGLVSPNSVAVDASGNIFIADAGNSVIKEALASSGYSTILTLGSGFASPQGVAVDASGNVFVADSGNSAVKEIVAAGAYTTINSLGSGFNGPYSVAVDASDNVFVADTFNNAVKEILATGNYTTVLSLGSGFNQPTSVAVDASGNVFVADYGNARVKEILAAGNYTTVNALGDVYRAPFGVTLDARGDLYVADISGSAVKEVLASGGYTTVLTLSVAFAHPAGVAVAPQGDVIVTDSGASTVSRLMTQGANFGSVAVGATSSAPLSITFTFPATVTIAAPSVVTFGANSLDFADAGTGDTCLAGTFFAGAQCTLNASFAPRLSGYREGAVSLTDNSGNPVATAYLYGMGTGPQITFGPATNTTLARSTIVPSAVAVDGSSNIFYADSTANTVTELLASESYSTPHTVGSGFNNPNALALDGEGNLFVADTGNNAVKEVLVNGGYTTVVSLGSGFSAPLGVAVGGGGNVFVADTGNGAIKEIAFPGSYAATYSLRTGFTHPSSIAVDASGNVFVADSGSLKEILATGSYSSVNSLATIGSSSTIALDSNDNIFLADPSDNTIKQLLSAGGYAAAATIGSGFNAPAGLVVDGKGNIFVADKGNQAIKRLDTADPPAVIFLNTAYGTTSSDSPKTVTLTNVGNRGLTLPVSGSGSNPSISAGFTIGSSSTCPIASSTAGAGAILTGTSCTELISFTPDRVGSLSGSLVLTDDTLNAAAPNYAVQSISLNGTGTSASPAIFFSVANHVYGDPPFTVSATSDSPGTFTYSVVSGPATISGNTVTLTGAGSVTLQAAQAATANYAAGSATATFSVAAATPNISFSVANKVYGNPPFTVAATSNSPGAFTFSVLSGPATISGNTVTLTGTGSVTLQATQAATANYSAGTATAAFIVAAAKPAISFSVANKVYGDPPFTVAATSNSPGAFTYSVLSGPATISGNMVTLTGAGSVTLQASQSATANYAAGTATATFTVAAATPNIAFSVANKVYGNPPFTIAATSNSPGAFTYSVLSGPATISGNTVTLTGAGSVTLQASQAATTNYSDGTATATFSVAAAAPNIVFSVANHVYGNPPFAVAATSNSPGAFTYSVLAGSATISGNTVTLTGAGAVTLQAAQASTTNYTAGAARATFTAATATPNIAFSAANKVYGDPPFTIAATSNSPGAFTYSVLSGPATISGNTVTLTGAGSVNLQASQAATANYAAGTASATFTVAAATPNIAFSVANHIYGDPPFTVAATSNSPGAFTYSVLSGPATISGKTVTLTGAGLVVLQASQAATPSYGAGTATATFTVAAATTAISFSVANHVYGNAPFTVMATSNSPGAFTYSVVSGPATISGNTVTITGAGSVTLQASQAATANYSAASTAATFTIAAATPGIVFNVPNQNYGTLPFTVAATSNSPGAFTYSVVSGPATISGDTVTLTGSGSVTLQAAQAATTNYTAASTTTTFLVVEGLTIVANPSSGSVTPGGSVDFGLTLSPGGSSTFPHAIQLTATGLPNGASATFTPSSIAAGAGVTQAKMTIATTIQVACEQRPGGYPISPIAFGLVLLPAFGLKRARRHMKKLPLLLAIATLSLAALLGTSGCGTGLQSRNQHFTIAVTATDTVSGASSSTNVDLLVR